MNKTYIYIIMCIAALAITGCQSDDNLPVQHPDGYGQIRFVVEAGQTTSRAEDGYEAYSTDKHPATMGVFCSEIGLSNIQGSLAADSQSWTIANYWEDVTALPPYHFYGYMPYDAAVTLTEGKLSIPFTMPSDSGVTFDQKNAPLICREPTVLQAAFLDVKFYMQQTLTGFRLDFALGDKMDKVRDITIKSVKLKDKTDAENSVFVKSGTCYSEYSQVNGVWKSNGINWEDLQYITTPQTIEVFNNPSAEEPQTSTPLKLTTSMQTWGSTFFTIPATGFTPYIEVTYDVAVDNNNTVTRESVTSSIQLIKKNFSKYDPTTPGTPGTIYPIQIKIVPSYLYVLADDDQATGYIVIK